MPLFLSPGGPPPTGRTSPPSRPITRSIFSERPKDRLNETKTPLKTEDIARVLRDAESGDLSTQNDLMEYMLERDGDLAGHANLRQMRPTKFRWAVLPVDDTPRAKEVADRVHGIMRRIPDMRGVLFYMSDAILKGISVQEIDWYPDKSIAAIRWVHAKRYRFHWMTDTLEVVPDNPAQEWPWIPVDPKDYKFIVHKPKLRATHPARGGILRTLVWAFIFRHYSVKDWVTFSEIYGMPLRLAKYWPGAKQPDKDELKAAMEMLASDAYAVIDSRVVMEYVDAINRGVHPGQAIYDAMGRQYQISLLGQDQTSTHNPTGGRTQVEFGGAPILQDIVEGDCLDSMETMARQVMYPIVGFNFDWATADQYLPIFKIFFELPEDYQRTSNVDQVVHEEMGLPTTWGEIAKRFGRTLPEGMDPDTIVFFNEYVPPGFEGKPHVTIVKSGVSGMTTQQRQANAAAAQPAVGGEAGGQPGGRAPQPRALRGLPSSRQDAEEHLIAAFSMLATQARQLPPTTDPAQAELDARVDAIVPRAAAAMRQLAAPILQAMADSTSYEEIVQRLAQVYPDLDETGLERLLQRVWFTARLFGIAMQEFRTGGDA